MHLLLWRLVRWRTNMVQNTSAGSCVTPSLSSVLCGTPASRHLKHTTTSLLKPRNFALSTYNLNLLLIWPFPIKYLGSSSSHSQSCPALCFFHLYFFLLHLFSCNISPSQFWSSYLRHQFSPTDKLCPVWCYPAASFRAFSIIASLLVCLDQLLGDGVVSGDHKSFLNFNLCRTGCCGSATSLMVYQAYSFIRRHLIWNVASALCLHSKPRFHSHNSASPAQGSE